MKKKHSYRDKKRTLLIKNLINVINIVNGDDFFGPDGPSSASRVTARGKIHARLISTLII